jgi:hypothetical protein
MTDNYDINKDPQAPEWLKDKQDPRKRQDMTPIDVSQLPADAPKWLLAEMNQGDTSPMSAKKDAGVPSYEQIAGDALRLKKKTFTEADRTIARVIAQEDNASAEVQKRRVEGYSYLARQGYSQQEIAGMLVDRGMDQKKADKAVSVLKLLATDLVSKARSRTEVPAQEQIKKPIQ